jgi:hypothetical protein
MRTTVEIPDNLYRQIKARAALDGQTIKAFFLEAVRDKLTAAPAKPDEEIGWRAAFGAGDPEAVAEVQRIIDEEFSTIDPEDWK